MRAPVDNKLRRVCGARKSAIALGYVQALGCMQWPGLLSALAGYTHRRTLGYCEGVSDAANGEVRSRSRVYVFRLAKQARGRM